MQAKKAKQLLKARITRERQIYEMRKRAELRAAVSELERPWEAVERAPTLFSVSADEQLKVLADRFQKPGGFDLWTETDGPELFKTVDGLPSARFFPKGVVHSVKPYGKLPELEGSVEGSSSAGESESESELDEDLDGYEKDRMISSHRSRDGEVVPGLESESTNVVGKQNFGYRGNQRNSGRRASPKRYPRVIGCSQLDDLMDGSTSGSEGDVQLGEQRVENGRSRRTSAGRMKGRDVYNLEDGLRSSGLDLKNGAKSNGRLADGGKSIGRLVRKRNLRKSGSLNAGGSGESSRVGFDRKQRGERYGGGFRSGRINRTKGPSDLDAGVHDMSLQEDGSYGL